MFTILKYITTALNTFFIAVLLFFMHRLRWSDPDDRASIIGFTAMSLAYMASVIAMWT